MLDYDGSDIFKPVLKLSFDNLSTPSLKRCFAYFAILPIDYDMKKDELIQHWMAVGFLEPSKESNMVMEDIGNVYFNILLATSFLQNTRKDMYGNVINCKMHDLVHNFALSISKSKTLTLEGDSMDNVSNVQCLFILCDGQMTLRVSSITDGFMKLRIAVSGNFDFVRMLSNFKCIRVLKLFGHGITELPNSIGQLIHLRLLQISNTKIKELPKSITELYNLQSLRIEDCCYFVELPEDLCNLINFRHIYLDNFKDVDYILQTPKYMGQLTCLQTLPFFVVSEDEGHCIKELGHLNQLSGNLDIYNLEYVSDMGDGRSASLAKKAKLFKLGFYWGVDDSLRRAEDDYDNDEEVLEGLQPHQNLKSLTIKFYEGKKSPSWMLTSRDVGVGLSQYANLIEIILKNCTQCEEVPTLGHLPGLGFLEIEGMENVRCIGTEFYSDCNTRNTLFPALRRLKLQGMCKLVEWKDAKELKIGAEVFPCLEELIIEDCNVLTSAPCHFPSLQKLKIMNVIKTAIEKILNLTTLKSLHISDIL